jgi:hypothetical protein
LENTQNVYGIFLAADIQVLFHSRKEGRKEGSKEAAKANNSN